MTTQYWLVKSEPDTYGWDTFVRDGRTDWTGVRNYAARLHLKAMRPGDQVLFYHSNEGKAVVGIARVTKPAFPDTTCPEPVERTAQFDGWVAVELAPVAPLKNPVTLATIKTEPALKNIALIRQSRLSVMPLKPAEFARIVKLGGR
jgi:predicted RNA-binding protein with PUA-like domain